MTTDAPIGRAAATEAGCRIVLVGTSYGGLSAMQRLLPALPADFAAPLVIVQHRSRDDDHGFLREFLQKGCALPVREPNDKDEVAPGVVYLAPRDYHLFVERGGFALSTDALVTYARPSIDVLFESAADAYGAGAVGVILTGANADGARGLARIKAHGGTAVVQAPGDAEAPQMPRAAIEELKRAGTPVDHVVPLAGIATLLTNLCRKRPRASAGSGASR